MASADINASRSETLSRGVLAVDFPQVTPSLLFQLRTVERAIAGPSMGQRNIFQFLSSPLGVSGYARGLHSIEAPDRPWFQMSRSEARISMQEAAEAGFVNGFWRNEAKLSKTTRNQMTPDERKSYDLWAAATGAYYLAHEIGFQSTIVRLLQEGARRAQITEEAEGIINLISSGISNNNAVAEGSFKSLLEAYVNLGANSSSNAVA